MSGTNLDWLLGPVNAENVARQEDKEVAAQISKLSENGQHDKADKMFYDWAAKNKEKQLNERGETDQQNAQDAAGASIVFDAWNKSKAERKTKATQATDLNNPKNENEKRIKNPKSKLNKSADNSSNTKKRVNITKKARDKLNSLPSSEANKARGVAGDKIFGDVKPVLIQMEGDKVIQGQYNSRIVLGRDRPASRVSGKSGTGQTQCGAIDLVAGALAYKLKGFDDEGEKQFCDPDMYSDAARIYISQNADVDEYFNIAEGKLGSSVDRSCVGIKADGVRIVAREGIKLVTQTDVVNSQGGLSPINDIYGIDLIAMNDDSDLQPIVKGDNLSDCLDKIITEINKLNGIVHSLYIHQNALNSQLTNHYHYAPAKIFEVAIPGGITGYYWKTTPSPPLVATGIQTMVNHEVSVHRDLQTQKATLENTKLNYLLPSGGKYINSRYNTSN
jgi:hypothetical protein